MSHKDLVLTRRPRATCIAHPYDDQGQIMWEVGFYRGPNWISMGRAAGESESAWADAYRRFMTVRRGKA